MALGYGATDSNTQKQASSNTLGTVNQVLSALLIVQQHGLLGEEELILARKFCKQIQMRR